MLQRVKEEEVVITIAQTNVEEVNISISDGTQQSMKMGSLNVDHEYQEPIEKLNMFTSRNQPKCDHFMQVHATSCL
jgi:hypothetical protein